MVQAPIALGRQGFLSLLASWPRLMGELLAIEREGDSLKTNPQSYLLASTSMCMQVHALVYMHTHTT